MAAHAPLPLNLTSFEEIRKSGAVYVDKTPLICNFLRSRAPIFYSRPRGFGKTLLCSTLHSFFTHGLEYFKGLYLEQWWQELPENQKEWFIGKAVVRLDFSAMDSGTVPDFKASFKEALKTAIAAVAPDFDAKDEWDAWLIFNKFLQSREMASVVLLIDEYDAPLTRFADRPRELLRVWSVLENFYAMLKSLSSKLQFFFYTGITLYQPIELFPRFNQFVDYTCSSKYLPLLGFSEQELRLYFPTQLQHASEILNLSVDELCGRLKEHYGGFRFLPQDETTLYAPHSVLSFLNAPEKGFEHCWYRPGELSDRGLSSFACYCDITQGTLSQRSYLFPYALIRGEALQVDNNAKTLRPARDPKLLLFRNGYLTIKEAELDAKGKAYNLILGLTNREVTDAVILSLREALGATLKEETQNLKEALHTGNLPELERIFTCCLNSLDYDLGYFGSANSCRCLIATCLFISGYEVNSQAYISSERNDFLLTLAEDKLCYSFEFREQPEDAEPEKTLQEILEQAATNEYVLPEAYGLKRVAVVLEPDYRRIVKMALVRERA